MRKLFKLPKKSIYHVLLGFSICMEVLLRHQPFAILPDGRKFYSKINVVSRSDRVGGSSFGIAVALSKIFDYQVRLVASVGQDAKKLDRMYVETEVSNEKIDFYPLPVKIRTSTGFVHLPVGEPPYIFSDKTPYAEMPVNDVINQVSLAQPLIKVASGVMPDEYEIVKTLFETCPEAVNILNPRIQLTQEKRLFHLLLRSNPLLILNNEELSAYYNDIILENEVKPDLLTPLHHKGADIIIVTCNECGAIMSSPKHKLWIPQPVIKFGPAKDRTGAGDAFLSAIIAAILQGLEPEEAMRQAAILAGLKVLREGGANLPPKEDFIRKIQEMEIEKEK